MKTLITTVAFALASACGRAQVSEEPSQSSPIHFRVLHTKRVNVGDHALIMNRVVPPVLPARPPADPAPPRTALSEAARQAFLNRSRKKSVFLFVGATVYDHQISELHWQDANGSYRAFTNADLTPLPMVPSIETDDTSYSFLVMPTNLTRAEAEMHRPAGAPAIPQPADFGDIQCGYMVVEDPAKPVSDEACAPIGVLLGYFSANKQAIVDAYAARQAAGIAQAQSLKDHPPKPKDTVVNYWIGSLPPRSDGSPANPAGGQP